MRNQGLGSWPARRARRTPEHTAWVHQGRRTGYRELHRRVQLLAAALRGRGVRRGDRVAYLGENHPAFLETLFAAGLLGAVFVPLNTRSSADEIGYVLADSGSTVLVRTARHDESVTALHDRLPVRLPVTLGSPGAGEVGYEELLGGNGAERDEDLDEPVGHDDACLIMYTSGTTGRPKGVVLTHGNLVWNCLDVVVDLDITSATVALVHAPLFHAAALGMICLPTLLKGGTVLLADFDPGRALELIPEHRVDFVFGVPTMYEAMSRHPGWARADLSSLRIALCGGARASDRTVRTCLDRGLPFAQGYGLTETSPAATVVPPSYTARRPASVGPANFFSDARLVRPDGTDAAVGEPGEILLKGPHVMRGYWGRPDATDAVLRDGWLATGDIAVQDEDGFLRVIDRIKDMYVSGGENVYPAEVERVLAEHPGVLRCAVLGVPDDTWGEAGLALVEPAAGGSVTGEELRAHVRGRLAAYKTPATIRLVPGLPLNGAGKVDRARLRARWAPTAPAPDGPISDQAGRAPAATTTEA
ncbi:long-chain fatty acid--CoA ligase [Streptomyces sp. NPDC047000]|uniref:acyl-CoA synthetase n=1 Tax=Streptomyces sp. NPDC047000 TaxID=3155474 RepID=UPI00340781D1